MDHHHSTLNIQEVIKTQDVYDATNQTSRAQPNKLLVAAIDFGTTYSGIAWSWCREFDKYPLRISTLQWACNIGQGTASTKTTTSLLLKPNGEFKAFGYEAEEQYSELADDNAHHGWYFFRHFKMMLFNNEELKRDTKLYDDQNHEMPARLVFEHGIRHLKEKLLKELENNGTSALVHEDEIFWVITVPAIWNDAAKQFTREAAVGAGIPSHRIRLALEPEAASVYVKEVLAERTTGENGAQLQSFSPGTKYIILDIGGGTVDVSLKEILNDDSIKEIHQASGGPWGGLNVNTNFLKFLRGLIGNDVLDDLKTNHKACWLDLEKEIEFKKRNICGDKDARILLHIPAELQELYEEKNDKKLINATAFESKYAGKIDIKRSALRIDKSIVEEFYKDSIDNIVKHTKSILSKPEAAGISHIILVGGFAESEYVKRTISQSFSNIHVFTPDDPWLAVMRGATIFGQKPGIVKTRISKYTYGTSVLRYFIEGYDLEENRENINGDPYCKNVFNKLAEIGESFEVGHIVQTEVFALKADMTKMTVKFFRSSENDPVYVDGNSCKQIGSLLVDMPGSGTDRKVTVSLMFGDEEITCEGQNNEGKTVSVKLDMLSD